MIQVFSNSLGTDELAAILSVFKSGWVGNCGVTKEFEKQFCTKLHLPQSYPDIIQFEKTHRALATNCCTSALTVALRSLGIGPGDEVIMPAINFIGCAQVVKLCGAVPVYADVDMDYFQITAEQIAKKRTDKTKAVLILHYGGHPCDMQEILNASEGLFVIEDCANAVSSYCGENHCGTIGDAGVFSFDAMKILVTGDGGMLAIDRKYEQKAHSFRYLGMKPDQAAGIDSFRRKDRWWEFETQEVSDRNTMNDIAAAIGIEQLKKLPSFIVRRKQIWETYKKEIGGPPEPRAGDTSSYYLYWIKHSKRDLLAHYLAEYDIYTTFRYYPLASLKNCDRIKETALCLPLHQNLSDNDVDKIIDRVKTFTRSN